MNAVTTRLSVILLAVASLKYTGDARAQLRTPATVKVPQAAMRPSPAPNVLYEQLTRPDPNSQFAEQRIDALDVLGIGGSEIQELRLTYQDLDGDGIPEALFTIQIDNSNDVSLVVLKRKGNQWYRLASPAKFSCWCKYEDFPLDTFAEIRPWRYGNNEPAKLLFVRDSGGGTGGYFRKLNLYALRGFVLDEVFSFTEDLRGCNILDGQCDLHHEEVTTETNDEPLALLAVSYERHTVSGEYFRDSTWWVGLPVGQCKAYTWSAQRRKFLENAAATAEYCSHLGDLTGDFCTR